MQFHQLDEHLCNILTDTSRGAGPSPSWAIEILALRTNRALTVLVSLQPISMKYSRDQWTRRVTTRVDLISSVQFMCCELALTLELAHIWTLVSSWILFSNFFNYSATEREFSNTGLTLLLFSCLRMTSMISGRYFYILHCDIFILWCLSLL